MNEIDAAALEAELLPTLRHDPGLIDRALGRSPLPDWLKSRHAEATVQIDHLKVLGAQLDGVHGRLEWDAAHAELVGLEAKLERAAIKGIVEANLNGATPVYRFTGQVKNLPWQSGTVDATGSAASSGFGAQLLQRLAIEGTFAGAGLDYGAVTANKVNGSFRLTWVRNAPHWQFPSFNLRANDENYTGHGAAGSDGKLLLPLTGKSGDLRLAGTASTLAAEETPQK
jgi:hypothetical protein